ENGNELVRLKGNRGLLGFKREHLFIETGRRARLQLFRKLGRARWLRSKADSSEALIGWLGGSAAVIARDHDEGNSKKNIPSRLLLGLSKDDLLYIQEQILNAVNGGFTD
ncbi:TPA: phage virion morphogenesis protein, partial [Neisseria meningitidis]